MPLPPIPLPADVVDYIHAIFLRTEQQIAERIERQPNVHEESLDQAFIEFVGLNSGPHRTPSDTVVDIDVHFVGGGWHFERWEVADIGMIVTFRRLGRMLRRKVVLLQSKRIYPREAEFVEAHGLARPGGFGYLVREDVLPIQQPRAFHFDRDCRYKALQVGDQQWTLVAEYEQRWGIPIHYMLYHPGQVPTQATVPTQIPLAQRPPVTVGTTVMQATLLRAGTTQFPRNYAPSFQDLVGPSGIPGTRLPGFIIDDVLGCREGYVPDNFYTDEGINRIFNLRGAPIAAAIMIEIDLPENVEAQ